MSQMSATARAVPRPSRPRGATVRPELRVVPAASPGAGHLGYAVLLVALIIGGLLMMLMLNMARAEGSFVLSDLREDQAALHAEQARLQTELAELSSPATLAEKAEKLGMQPSPSTATIRLSDHAVLGVAAGVRDGRTFTVDLPAPSQAEADQQPGE